MLCLDLPLAANTHRAVGWQEGCLEMRGKTCTVKDPEDPFVIKMGKIKIRDILKIMDFCGKWNPMATT